VKRALREPATARHFPRIYALVRQVPAGRVVSYGMVAAMVDRCTPRIVGYAMASVPAGSDVPWHRVINSQGRISLRDGAELQRRLLETEGVVFDERGRVDLKRFAWKGPGTRRRRPAGESART
jgi:methylated-DNA-protein-cysteine methyltransferase-like protein